MSKRYRDVAPVRNEDGSLLGEFGVSHRHAHRVGSKQIMSDVELNADPLQSGTHRHAFELAKQHYRRDIGERVRFGKGSQLPGAH